MKLLTINTHSLIEENYEEKLNIFVNAIIKEKPDIVAMQEVNQLCSEKIIDNSRLAKMIECQNTVPVHKDNHVARIAQLLTEHGLDYYWTWLPIKIGYDKFDEGLAFLSRFPITNTDTFLISKNDDYKNWKTRKILGIQTKKGWFYSVHMGWWNDGDESFKNQWERLNVHLQDKGQVWLMGDFNSQSDIRDEGYDCVLNSGWIDTYTIAKNSDSGITVENIIDGWDNNKSQKMRIDYIWSNNDKISVLSSNVIFNGINEAIISDHYGILIDIED